MNNFQIILTSVFAFFIIVGAVLFASYRSDNSQYSDVQVTVWGTISEDVFTGTIEVLKNDLGSDINMLYTEIDPALFDRALVEALASGKGPDVVLLSQDYLARFADKIYAIPYKTFPERDFKDTFVEGGEIYLRQEGVLAVPFFVDPMLMYWNRAIVSSAGIAKPPAKWSEIPAFAQKISKSDNNANILRSAISFGEYRNVSNAKQLVSTLILQTGNPIIKIGADSVSVVVLDSIEDQSTGLNTAESAVRFFADYSNIKKPVYSWNRAMPLSKDAFVSEDLALYFGFASEYQNIKDKNPNLNFDVAVMPQIGDDRARVTFGDIYALAIMKSSPNIVPAYSLVSYLTSPEVVNVWTGFYLSSPARRDMIMEGSDNAVYSSILSSALISRAWLEPERDGVNVIFRDMIENVTTGRSKLEEAVDDASQRLGLMVQ